MKNQLVAILILTFMLLLCNEFQKASIFECSGQNLWYISLPGSLYPVSAGNWRVKWPGRAAHKRLPPSGQHHLKKTLTLKPLSKGSSHGVNNFLSIVVHLSFLTSLQVGLKCSVLHCTVTKKTICHFRRPRH